MITAKKSPFTGLCKRKNKSAVNQIYIFPLWYMFVKICQYFHCRTGNLQHRSVHNWWKLFRDFQHRGLVCGVQSRRFHFRSDPGRDVDSHWRRWSHGHRHRDLSGSIGHHYHRFYHHRPLFDLLRGHSQCSVVCYCSGHNTGASHPKRLFHRQICGFS